MQTQLGPKSLEKEFNLRNYKPTRELHVYFYDFSVRREVLGTRRNGFFRAGEGTGEGEGEGEGLGLSLLTADSDRMAGRRLWGRE